MREHGPVLPLEQRCIEPGHWLIEGRTVKAAYQGRSRNVLGWYVTPLESDPEPPTGVFRTLNEARDWIRDQVAPAGE